MRNIRKIFSLLIFLFILLSLLSLSRAVLAQDSEKYEQMTLSFDLRGEITTNLAHVNANLSLIPQNDLRQEIQSLTFIGNEISHSEKNIIFDWPSASGTSPFGYRSVIATKIQIPNSNYVSFPLKSTDFNEFTLPSENIDSDSQIIIEKSKYLTSGKSDAMEAVFEIAEFVNSNLTYDESYIGAEKKASQVLQEKRGVCEEYTLLFISLARAAGIPARYISGLAYSNIKKAFGPHAWAEIYLPSQGWIPFDTTFGQHGFIDTTHIALSKSKDKQSAVLYTYTSTSFVPKELGLNASIIEKTKSSPKANIQLDLPEKKVMAGSYAPLQVKIKNPLSNYLPLNLYLTKAPGIYGKNEKHLLLKPLEERIVYFILRIPEDIEEGFNYESVIALETQFNDFATTNISFAKNRYSFIDLEKANSFIEERSHGINITAPIIQNQISIIDFSPKVLNYGRNEVSLKIKTNYCSSLLLKINNLASNLSDISGERELRFELAGKYALSEKLDIQVQCFTENQRSSDEKTFSVSLTNVPWYVKIWKFFSELFS